MSEPLHDRINALRRQKNAVILAHNYQLGEVQDIADFVGDSLELSRKAACTEADVIVFCGVRFMAETAAILSPDKTVLVPDPEAGCPMADMITADELRALKAQHPSAVVVCYVNSSAEVKAESDCCCTSANATKVVESLPEREIIFVPDKYLGQYVMEATGRDMLLWHGYCPTHVRILASDIAAMRAAHPEAEVLAHPECTREVRAAAGHVLSTGGMCRFASESQATEFILATETGLLHRLRKENPGKVFFPASERGVCPNMKRTRLEKILWALEDLKHRVEVPEPTRSKAKAAIDRMLEI